MKNLFVSALAFSTVLMASSVGHASEDAELTSQKRYDFVCEGTTADGLHKLGVSGTINGTRGTLDGQWVNSYMDGHMFQDFHLPRGSVFMRDGQITVLDIRGFSTERRAMVLRYYGEGSEQNYLALSNEDHPIDTKTVSCSVRDGF